MRTIFPYVLGATTPELLAKQWELETLLKALKRKERELAAQVRASDSWKADILNWVAEADELGLIENSNYLYSDEQELISLLHIVVEQHGNVVYSPVSGLETAATEYLRLQGEESEIALQV